MHDHMTIILGGYLGKVNQRKIANRPLELHTWDVIFRIQVQFGFLNKGGIY